MSRRQSLKRQKAFSDAVDRAIREAGGVEIDGFGQKVVYGTFIGASFHLLTRVGLARVSSWPSAFLGDEPGQPGGGQLHVKFEDVALARSSDLPCAAPLNRFSGKWHHDLWNLGPEEAYARTVEILRSVAIEVPA